MPSSSVTTWPPVSTPMSASISLRRSPKPGAFTATQRRAPRSLFTTSVARASPSTSSAMMSSGSPVRATCSRSGSRSFMTPIFLSVSRTPDVLQHDLHLLGVGDEVGREVAAVELEALDHLDLRLRRLRLLDGDDALVADLLHGVGDEIADGRVVVGGDGGDLRLLQAALDRPRLLAQGLHRPAGPAIEPALEIDGAGARDDVAQPLGVDGVREHGGRAGAVADGVPGALGRLADHLGAEVLGGVLQLHLLRDGHAVVADEGHAEALLDEHALGLRPQGDAHGVGQRR